MEIPSAHHRGVSFGATAETAACGMRQLATSSYFDLKK